MASGDCAKACEEAGMDCEELCPDSPCSKKKCDAPKASD
jgi:hypothetical protein